MEERRVAWDNGAPKRILLATDLSARCDEALDRAVQLAAQCGATMHVLHVIEKHAKFHLPSWRRDRPEESRWVGWRSRPTSCPHPATCC